MEVGKTYNFIEERDVGAIGAREDETFVGTVLEQGVTSGGNMRYAKIEGGGKRRGSYSYDV